jgi:DNA invertase Pin-like site-specific DNA recombinase
MSEQTPAILYAAKSTSDPRGSIPTQRQDCEAMAEREGWTVEGSYSDEAKSAYKGNRGDGLVKAREHAERAAERGECMLVVQHTDRLARGDGVAAQHLVEVVLWANRVGVRIRSVQDDRTGESVLDAALTGQRNHEDSERKSQAVKAGLRRTVEKGEWRGGTAPCGYKVVREFDDRGRMKSRELVKHPEDVDALTLLWQLASEGASVQRIELELNRRGYLTRPMRAEHVAGPWNVRKILMALDNPIYAALIDWHGETFEGNWEPYVDPETFWRLKTEREQRYHATRRNRGRPAVAYLLSELATCGVCGQPMHALTRHSRRADRSPSRRYLCRSNRAHHLESPLRCSAPPLDAEVVDATVRAGLSHLLKDGEALRERMQQAHAAERDALAKLAERAEGDRKAALRAAELADRAYADGLGTDDPDILEVKARAAALKRRSAHEATQRREAALDAINALEQDAQTLAPGSGKSSVLVELWTRLSDAAGEDTRVLNAALRESFSEFRLTREPNGDVRIDPVLSLDAASRLAKPDVPESLTAPNSARAANSHTP